MARPPDLTSTSTWPGVDQVRVADLLHVHAPQLGPAPGALEEQLGDVPQRVAALHGVRLGRVGRQVRQRHAGLGHLAAWLRCCFGDGEIAARSPSRGRQQAAEHAQRTQAGHDPAPDAVFASTFASTHGAGLPAGAPERRANATMLPRIPSVCAARPRTGPKSSLGFADSAPKPLISQRKWPARTASGGMVAGACVAPRPQLFQPCCRRRRRLAPTPWPI
jgi:hypothetical protein